MITLTNEASDKVIKIILCGLVSDKLNNNVDLRKFFSEGIAEIIGKNSILNVSIDSAISAINFHKPELIVCFGSCPPSAVNLMPLRFACDVNNVHLAIWLHDDPYEFDWNYNVVDVADTIFSNDLWASKHYQHPRVFHLPLAASKNFNYRVLTDKYISDVFFCGVAFENRVKLLRDLSSTLEKYKTDIYGEGWPEDLPGSINKRMANGEVADRCANSMATLYMGRSFNYANDRYQLTPSTPGPRLFEAAMSGAVQLVFINSLEILEYFEEGEGILLFDDAKSLKIHLDKLRDEPKFRAKVASLGQERCIRNHTYAIRAKEVLRVCTPNI